MHGPLRHPVVAFLLVCSLCAVYFGLQLHDWGHGRAHRVAVQRDDLGSPRKSSLLKKLGLSARPADTAAPAPLVEAARADLRLLPPMPMRAVAIHIDDRDLYDPETGLQANSRERGGANGSAPQEWS